MVLIKVNKKIIHRGPIWPKKAYFDRDHEDLLPINYWKKKFSWLFAAWEQSKGSTHIKTNNIFIAEFYEKNNKNSFKKSNLIAQPIFFVYGISVKSRPLWTYRQWLLWIFIFQMYLSLHWKKKAINHFSLIFTKLPLFFCDSKLNTLTFWA